MVNFDEITDKNEAEDNKIGHIFQNHQYRILITGGSRLRKSNAILNLISHQVDIDKILLYIQDL